MKNITLTFASVFILLAGSLSAQGELGIHFDSGESAPGDTVNILLKATGFENLLSAQFSINWDPNVYEFISTQDYNSDVSYLDENAIGDSQGNTDDGIITFIWLDYDFAGITVPDTSVLVSFNFKTIGEDCDTTSFKITDEPREIDVFDIAEQNIPLVSTSGFWKISLATAIENLDAATETLIVSPNPINIGEEFQMTWSDERDSNVSLQLFSTSGALLSSDIIRLVDSELNYTTDAQIGAGSYFLLMKGEESGKKATATLIVE